MPREPRARNQNDDRISVGGDAVSEKPEDAGRDGDGGMGEDAESLTSLGDAPSVDVFGVGKTSGEVLLSCEENSVVSLRFFFAEPRLRFGAIIQSELVAGRA